MTSSHLSREDLRICVDVVKTIARERGIAKDPAAVAELMTAVGRCFKRGIRVHDELVEAMRDNASQEVPGQ
ncbi:hypothetical protein HGP14_23120 [Rhizobium sp. P32RR-XVIII]|uniref:hypothetical protein n=1 Tax=Rhizobium sp. P32RR-XVIII TaxID=2726738 RepID=UPI0014573E6B|nr:hypothetical protein [Rhizobium sp. P32RR-XVIII]NLS06230.1 hypothetical protein [Rhizobium sp. P32RR-XVIII]